MNLFLIKMSYENLNKFAVNIRSVEKFTEKTVGDKILIMFLNWNVPVFSSLGQPVINDGEVMAKLCKEIGYDCYYVCNSSVKMAKKILEKIFSMKHKRVIFYYSGHGASTAGGDKTEEDGRDENFVFAGGYLKDDDFAKILEDNFRCDHLSLIADCCHSGTIFDLEKLPENIASKICSLTSCSDSQTSIQLIKNGLFTLQLCQLYDKDSGIIDIEKLKSRLSSWGMSIKTFGDVSELFEEKPRSRGIGSFILGTIADEIMNKMTEEEELKQKYQSNTVQHSEKKITIKKI